jgi:dTDP-4-amino-4,6-dideoxygalactose transaminase
VEVEDDGFNMSVSEMEKLLDDRSAVVATHQFGIPCEIERIVEIARKKGALVIEDAAASMGSRVNGRLVGTFGDAAFYSFDSTKLITVPMKGGAVTARDSGLFERIRNVYSDEIRPMPPAHKMMLLAQAAVLNIIEQHSLYGLFHRLMFSSRGRFTTDGPGLNQELNEFYRYDLSNWQAYIASRQVCRIEEIIEARRRRYSRLLDGLDGCRAFEPPPRDKASEWACIRFPIRVRGDKIAYYNKAIRHGIDFAFSFTFIACPDSFSNAKRLADSVLDLPFYLKMSDDDLQRVVRVLKMLDEEARRED